MSETYTASPVAKLRPSISDELLQRAILSPWKMSEFATVHDWAYARKTSLSSRLRFVCTFVAIDRPRQPRRLYCRPI